MRSFDYNLKLTYFNNSITSCNSQNICTRTIPGRVASNWVLTSSITSKPLREFAFAPADFSPVKFEISSKRTDASHLYNFTVCYRIIKKILSKSRYYKILQNTVENNTKFLTMKVSQEMEVYNSINKEVSCIIRLKFYK